MALTVSQLAAIIGTQVLVHVGRYGRSIVTLGNCYWQGTVTDVREVYGRVDVLIEPVSGQGACWCDYSQVKKGKD